MRILNQSFLFFTLVTGLWGQFTLPELDRALDRAGNSLVATSPDGTFTIQGSLQLDTWFYYADDQGGPPGFFFVSPGRDWELSPRLTGRVDAFLGHHLYLHGKFRWDDGVHPGVGFFYGDHTEVRLDELFLRITASPAFHIQLGQFTPLIGNFLSRQNSWDMGTISYPLLYENPTSVSDEFVPANADAFAARRNVADNKIAWIPVLWAPLYTQGISLFGSTHQWQYSLNVTNSAPSSRGIVWNNGDFDYPTWSGRIAHQFGPDFTMGLNASTGSYFRSNLASRLPAGTDPGDHKQILLGLDLQWAHRHWEVWAELYLNRYEIPNVEDDADMASYYVEVRRQLSPKWWMAARWNQELYKRIQTSTGPQDWDNDLYRLDLTLGNRFMRNAQIKLQYSFQNQDADFQNGRHFLVGEFTIRL